MGLAHYHESFPEVWPWEPIGDEFLITAWLYYYMLYCCSLCEKPSLHPFGLCATQTFFVPRSLTGHHDSSSFGVGGGESNGLQGNNLRNVRQRRGGQERTEWAKTQSQSPKSQNLKMSTSSNYQNSRHFTVDRGRSSSLHRFFSFAG